MSERSSVRLGRRLSCRVGRDFPHHSALRWLRGGRAAPSWHSPDWIQEERTHSMLPAPPGCPHQRPVLQYVLKSVTHGGLPFPNLLAAACLRQKCARSCVSLFFPAADVFWLGGEFQNLAEAISPKHQSSSPACLPVLPTVFTGAHSALSTFFIVVFHLLPPGTAADKSGGPRLPAARHASSCSSQHTAARAGPHAPHSFACRLPSGEKCCLLPASSRS